MHVSVRGCFWKPQCGESIPMLVPSDHWNWFLPECQTPDVHHPCHPSNISVRRTEDERYQISYLKVAPGKRTQSKKTLKLNELNGKLSSLHGIIHNASRHSYLRVHSTHTFSLHFICAWPLHSIPWVDIRK